MHLEPFLLWTSKYSKTCIMIHIEICAHRIHWNSNCLQDAFDDAVQRALRIDFTTSQTADVGLTLASNIHTWICWLNHPHNFQAVSVFESTIRYVGGIVVSWSTTVRLWSCKLADFNCKFTFSRPTNYLGPKTLRCLIRPVCSLISSFTHGRMINSNSLTVACFFITTRQRLA